MGFINLPFKKAYALWCYLQRRHISCNIDPAIDGEIVDNFSADIAVWRVSYDDTANKTVTEIILRWMKMRDKGLKYCPFCGGIAEIKHNYKTSGYVSYEVARVVCTECGCGTPSVIVDGFMGADGTEQDAIDAWNRRF